MTLPQTMFALTLKGHGYSGTAEGPSIQSLEPWLTGEEIPVPVPGKGQVLVKMARASINPSDLHFIKGEYGIPRVKGAPAGFEGSGTVVATGEGAEKLAGRRVGFVMSGTWAEYVVVDASSCVSVMDGISDEDAAALVVNPLTAIAMFEEVKLSGSKSFILTAAASQLCKLICGLAKEEGYRPIAIVRREEQCQHLVDLGAAHALDCTSESFKTDIGKLLAEEKPRVMLDAVSDQTSADIFFAMPSRSRWIVYGKLSPQLPKLTQMGQFIFMDKKIEGFWLTKWLRDSPPEVSRAAAKKVQDMYASGKWRTEVAALVPLREAHARLPGLLSAANHGKVMLTP